MSTNRIAHLTSATLLTLLTAACSGGTGTTTTGSGANDPTAAFSDEELVHIYAGVEAMGLDSAQIEFDGRDLIVEGDMVVNADDALARGRSADTTDADDVVRKGYFFNSKYLVVGRPSVQMQELAVPPGSFGMAFSSSVTSAWRDAFVYAAKKWSTNECINITESSGGTLKVETNGSLASNVLADARLPTLTYDRRGQVTGAKAGTRIRINSNKTNSTAEMRHIAMHELGHTLGFTHQTEGSHVSATSSGTSYGSIMEKSLGSAYSDLQADDKKTRELLFKKVTTTTRAGTTSKCAPLVQIPR